MWKVTEKLYGLDSTRAECFLGWTLPLYSASCFYICLIKMTTLHDYIADISTVD